MKGIATDLVSGRQEPRELETLIGSLPIVSDVAGGAEALRSLILELAVRGRLIPSDPGARPVALVGKDEGGGVGRKARVDPQPPLSDSEFPWCLPENWRWARVNDTGTYVNGLAFKPSDWETKGRPIIRIQNLTDATKEPNRTTAEFGDDYIVRRGDLLVSWSATLDVFIWDREDGVLNQHIFRVLPNRSTVVPRFLYYALRERIRAMASSDDAHGLVMKHINRGPFLAFPFAFPPLSEQKRIVAKVDQLMALCDDLEAKQTKKRDLAIQSTFSALTALNTAENAAALATAWQRLNRNFPLVSSEPGMVADLRGSVLSLAVSGRLVVASKARLVDVPVGEHYDPEFEIPEHWKWAPLGQLCRFIDYRGRTPRKTKEGVRLITAKNVRMGYIKEDPVEYIAAEEFDRWMTRGLPACGDVLFTTEAPLGNVAQLLTRERVALAQRIITLHPIVAGLDPVYLRMALMSPLVQATIKAKATGTTAQGIKAARLKLVPFPVPPPDEQARMVARVDSLMSLLDDLEAKLRKQEETATRLAESLAAAVAG